MPTNVDTPNQRMSEKDLMGAALEMLRWHQYLTYHTFDSRRSTAGFPDIVAIRAEKGDRPPDGLIVECKTEDGKVTPEQGLWLEVFEAIKLDCWVLRPSGLVAFAERLKRGRP